MSTAREIRTIVVATDFSDNAAVAAAWAKELARQHAARIVLVHAVLPETPASPEFVPLTAELWEELRAIAEKRLADQAGELRKEGLEVEWQVAVGSSGVAVVDVAKERAADLIAAGTRGLTGWKRLLLGSTALRLVRDAPCPVLTVHPTDAGTPREVRTVLVPTDFSVDARLAADAARAVLGPGGARRIVLLHVYRVPIEAAPLRAETLRAEIHRVEGAASTRVRALSAELARPGVEIDALAVEGYPPDVILEQARALGADAIAMGVHGHSVLRRLVLGTTAERVLASAPCPVLTVRAEPGK